LDAFSQVTDSDIVKASIGRNYNELHKVLDSLKVWYAMHQDNDLEKGERGVVDRKKVYSVSDGKGTVKVYIFILDKVTQVIDEIVINFRHDNRQHVEDSRQIRNPSDFHVGLYSTDIVFKKK
jgi:hypothetical protein